MTPDQVKDTYRRLMDTAGEEVIVRRYYGSGTNRPFFDVRVMARVVGYLPQDLISGSNIKQGDRKVILLADDLVAAQLQLPLRQSDSIVVDGKELATTVSIDDSTRRVMGQLIAYELQVRG